MVNTNAPPPVLKNISLRFPILNANIDNLSALETFIQLFRSINKL
jgi:hypothetical protein